MNSLLYFFLYFLSHTETIDILYILSNVQQRLTETSVKQEIEINIYVILFKSHCYSVSTFYCNLSVLLEVTCD